MKERYLLEDVGDNNGFSLIMMATTSKHLK